MTASLCAGGKSIYVILLISIDRTMQKLIKREKWAWRQNMAAGGALNTRSNDRERREINKHHFHCQLKELIFYTFIAFDYFPKVHLQSYSCTKCVLIEFFYQYVLPSLWPLQLKRLLLLLSRLASLHPCSNTRLEAVPALLFDCELSVGQLYSSSSCTGIEFLRTISAQ